MRHIPNCFALFHIIRVLLIQCQFIQRANRRFTDQQNLSFASKIKPDLSDFKDNTFDLIIAFDLSKFITEQNITNLLEAIDRVMTPDGHCVFYLSEHNMQLLHEQSENAELVSTLDSAHGALSKYWKNVELLTQNYITGSIIKDYD